MATSDTVDERQCMHSRASVSGEMHLGRLKPLAVEVDICQRALTSYFNYAGQSICF
jgi:hypothetical protein